MKLEIWIAIGGIVVQSIIAVIGIVVQWRSNQRQIQIALAQANPTENVKPKEPINWPKIVLLPLYVFAAIFGIICLGITYAYLPPEWRILLFLLPFNVYMAYYNIKNSIRIGRWPSRGLFEFAEADKFGSRQQSSAILNESDKA